MSLLQMSLSGSVMILAVMLARAFAVNRLPKRTFLILWGIILLRLLIPFSISSPLSAYSMLNQHRPTVGGTLQSGLAAALPFPPPAALPAGETASAAPLPQISFYWIVWAVGFLLCALYFAIAYFRCRSAFQESLPLQNEFIASWLDRHHITRSLTVRQSSRITTPLTYGILKPVILLPKQLDWSRRAQNEYILAHELVHVKRFDAAAKLLLTLTLCIHWFNPLVWGMYLLCNRDMELSCDEAVVRSFGDTIKSDYARTLISMEERKSRMTPLCNHFSKNAIEERITAIMKRKKASVATLLAAALLVTGFSVILATSANAPAAPLSKQDHPILSDAQHQLLASFQFDEYETMSVADYQEKAWQQRDTPEQMAMLEQLMQNEALFALRDKDASAEFLFYVFNPLTAEQWKTWDYSGYAVSNFPASDNAKLEYWLTLSILDAKKLSVGQYRSAVLDVKHDLESFFQAFMQGEKAQKLQDASRMEAEIDAEIARLTKKYSSDALSIAVRYDFMPLTGLEKNNASQQSEQAREPRQAPYATAEDYRSLLMLKTPNYQAMTVADFNAALIDWANADYDRMERVNIDSARNDFAVPLTQEERTFVTLTVEASGNENAMLVRSLQNGKPMQDAGFTQQYNRSVENMGRSAWCTLYYQTTYHITDNTTLTIGARDRAIAGVQGEIERFWNETDFERLVLMNEREVHEQLTKIAAKYSGSEITFTIGDEQQFLFESMDERLLS